MLAPTGLAAGPLCLRLLNQNAVNQTFAPGAVPAGKVTSISVLLATLMVIAWQVATLSRRNPRAALPLAVTLLLACIGQAIICFIYFFTAPIITSVLSVICAAVGTALLARDATRGTTLTA